MIQAFISHSSVQKPFVDELVNILGHNCCIVDCYDFEPAYQSLSEIYRKIDKSTVFVLLLSKESLASEWVDKEIHYASAKMDPKDLDRFWPYIIDESLSIYECPDWIRKDRCFNLKKFKTAQLLAYDIKRKFQRILWQENPINKMVETVMIGRNEDIDAFENIYQSQRGMYLRSLIVSGRDGVGKDMFISQCLHKIGYEFEHRPFSLSFSNKEGVENFIIQLNLILKRYDKVSLEQLLSGSLQEKHVAAVSLFNELLEGNALISIDDDNSCILPNRQLADWLVELVEDPALFNRLGLFIKSRRIPNSFIDTEHKLFGHIQLNPLDTKDRKKLFYQLLRIHNLTDVSDQDVDFFVKRLLLSPTQIVKAVEALTRFPVSTVKRDINSLVAWGDVQIKPVIQKFFSDGESRNLMIVLSKLDFVSSEILENIYRGDFDEIMERLNDMMDYGIVTSFGPDERFFRLDHYVCEYIHRCHLKMPPDLNLCFEEVLQEKIESSSDITEDVSVYLYEKKQIIMSGRASSRDVLVPSVVVSSAMEVYNEQNYPLVIKICDMVLNDVHNYSPAQEREMRYWLCLALARTANKRFFKEVNFIKDVDNYFLKGFYYRNSKDFALAEDWLRKTLDQSPNMQRAKRELVTALLAQDKYDEALDLAKETYEKNPENSYQIQGYFRCLVRDTL